jgi:CheY-like chemotaxis protein
VIARRENAEAVLRVQDNGIGIAPDLLPYVFDLFIQADRTLARSEGGLGIGLTIVRNLVEVHNGTIAVDSEGPGQGSEFVVRLPLASGTQTGSEFAVPKAAVVPALRILVIEDHPDTRELLRAMLELDGHRVEVAEDGPPGVVIARAVRPDVVLIDIGLPSLDGYEVGRQLRRDLGKSVTLIALTGYSQPTDRRRSTEAGFDAHLVKPASPEEIRDVLAQRTRSMARE